MRNTQLAGSKIGRQAIVITFLAVLLASTASFAKTRIVFWADADPAIERIVAEFNSRSTDIEVELQIEPTTGTLSTIADKLVVAIAGGKTPDVMRFNRPYASEWAAKELLLPLDQHLTRLGIKREAFIPFAWDEGTYNGKVYVLPEGADARGVFYNKELLAQAGVDAGNLPTQLSAFDSLAAKLTKMDASGKYTQAGFIPWTNQGSYLFTWTPSFGGQLYDAARGKITVNDPHNVQVMDWMKEYSDRYGYSKLKGSFTGGTQAMVVETNSYSSNLKKYLDLEYGVMYMPAPIGGRQKATYAGGFGIAIPAGAQHVDEAAKFIAYWVSNEVQASRAKEKGYFPATLAAARDSFYLNDPIQRVFVDMLPNAQPRPNVPILGKLWDEIKTTGKRVLTDNEVPQAVLDDITKRMQQLLDETVRK